MRIGMGLAGAAALMMATAPLQALAGGPPPQGYVGDPVRGPDPRDDGRYPSASMGDPAIPDETGYGQGPAYVGEPVRGDDRGYDERDQYRDGGYQGGGYQQQGQWSSGQQYERREYQRREYGRQSDERYRDGDRDGGYGDEGRGDSRYSSGGGYRYEHSEEWRDQRGGYSDEAVYAFGSGGGFTNGYHSSFSSQSGWNSGGYIEPCNPRLRDAYGRSADCPGELSLRESFFAGGEGSVGPTWLGAPGGGGGGGGFAEASAGASASASAGASASVRVSIRGGGRGHGGHGGHGGGCGCHH
jgi:hypothetical protein